MARGRGGGKPPPCSEKPRKRLNRTTEKLSKLVTFKTGKLDSNAATPEGQYPFFTCSRETFRTDTYSFDCECVLLAGNNANGVYPIKYFSGKFDAYQRTYIVRAIDTNKLSNRYLYYAMQPKLDLLRSISTGVATKFLTLTILNDLDFEVPSFPTQRKIAAILSAYDDLIENNTRRIKILEEMAQALYREWFVHFRFPGHEKFKMVASRIANIPRGWEVKKLSEFVSTKYGYTESSNTEPVGPKYLRGMDINKTSYIDWSEVPYCPITPDDHSAYRLKLGDVVVIRMADPGKVGIVEQEVDAVFASYLIRVAPMDSRLSPYFLFYLMASTEYYGYITGASTGTTRKSASASVIADYEFLLPPKELVMEFERRVTEIRLLLTTVLKQTVNLRRTRDLLLPKLISGEIDVSNFDTRM